MEGERPAIAMKERLGTLPVNQPDSNRRLYEPVSQMDSEVGEDDAVADFVRRDNDMFQITTGLGCTEPLRVIQNGEHGAEDKGNRPIWQPSSVRRDRPDRLRPPLPYPPIAGGIRGISLSASRAGRNPEPVGIMITSALPARIS